MANFFESETWKRNGIPAAILLLLVLVLPIASFVVNRTFQRSAGIAPVKVDYKSVIGGGLAYKTERLMSLPLGDGANGIGLGADDSGPIIHFEVVAPGTDGDIWLVDHPASQAPGARVRRFDAKGNLEASFRVPAGSTLFTPGTGDDLWVDQSASDVQNETLVHYSGNGKTLASYILPDGLLARSLHLDSKGKVYVQIEQWWIDPETGNANFGSELVPVVNADGTRVVDTKDEAVAQTFIGPDDTFYRLLGTLTTDTAAYPAFDLEISGSDFQLTDHYSMPENMRAYAADSKGRVYAEGPMYRPPNAPSESTLGDRADQITYIHVFDKSGELARVPVQRPLGLAGWAPSAWPDDEGNLYSTVLRDGSLDIMKSSPVESEKLPVADGKPGAPQAQVLVTDDAPDSGDPYLAEDEVQRDAWRLVYAGLVSFDASMNPVADLCAEIPTVGAGVAEDGLSVTWTMASDRTWHDGEPVTARDVVATWEYLNRNSTVNGGRPFPGFDYIKDVTALGDKVTVTLWQPYGPAPEAFFPYVLPAHLIEESMAAANGSVFSRPIGAGPYKVERFEADRWMLSAHEGIALSAIKRLDVRFVDADEALELYSASRVPTVWTHVPDSSLPTLERDQIGEVRSVPTGRWWGTVFNSRNEALRNQSVRVALANIHPVDEIRALYGIEDTQTVSVYLSGAPVAHVSTAATVSAAVKSTLRGTKIDYAQTVRDDVDEIIKEQVDAVLARWSSAGATAQWAFARPRFYATYSERGYLARGAYAAGVGVFPGFLDPAWGSLFDPADTPSFGDDDGLAITFTDDATLRELHEKARATYDRAERAAIAEQVTKRAVELGLVVPERPETRGTALMRIEGYRSAAYPAGDFCNVTEWRVE